MADAASVEVVQRPLGDVLVADPQGNPGSQPGELDVDALGSVGGNLAALDTGLDEGQVGVVVVILHDCVLIGHGMACVLHRLAKEVSHFGGGFGGDVDLEDVFHLIVGNDGLFELGVLVLEVLDGLGEGDEVVGGVRGGFDVSVEVAVGKK